MLLMGKSTISIAIFNSYVKLPEGKSHTNNSGLSLFYLFGGFYDNASPWNDDLTDGPQGGPDK